eukprot:g32412.t1
MRQMRKQMLQTMGQQEEDNAPIQPVGLQFYRQILGPRVSPVMGREALNVSAALDALVGCHARLSSGYTGAEAEEFGEHQRRCYMAMKPGPIVSGELRPQVIDQREPEVALSPCSEHRVDDSHPRHGGAEPGHVEASENSESSQVVLELQQLREQVKLINEALSPEALQKQVLSVLPSLTPLQATWVLNRKRPIGLVFLGAAEFG